MGGEGGRGVMEVMEKGEERRGEEGIGEKGEGVEEINFRTG